MTDVSRTLGDFPSGSIIIPAHNESAVIHRTLAALQPVLATGFVEIVVSCNACTDATADIARQFKGVQVIETVKASKPAAINAAEALATGWPRLYLDADITMSPATLESMFATLQRAGGPLAVRAPCVIDLEGASWVVRAYYRARGRLESTQVALWGAGAFALSREGRRRFESFPDVVADDLFVDSVFENAEKLVPVTTPVVVRGPRNSRSLLAIIRRSHRGVLELEGRPDIRVQATTKRTVRSLALSARNPRQLADAFVYGSFAAAGRLANRFGRHSQWERDESSRTVLHEVA